MTKNCNNLGQFHLDGIPPAPKGTPQIEISYDINADGILNVTAVDKGTSKQNSITITNPNRLTSEEVEKMISEAEKYSKDDEISRKRVESKNNLEMYIYQTKSTLDKSKLRFDLSKCY